MEFPADTPRNNKDFREILRLLYAHCIMLASRKNHAEFGRFAQKKKPFRTTKNFFPKNYVLLFFFNAALIITSIT
ncbi:MAG: hypothetical protein IJ274_17095, partial [Lachnospiraceae bacterium]|nr:hypothetical protein [Lachnospiraceae bacterium]